MHPSLMFLRWRLLRCQEGTVPSYWLWHYVRSAPPKGTSVTFMCYGDKPTGEPNPPLPQHCHLALRLESEHNAKFVCIDSQGKICSDYRIVWAHSKSGTRFLFCQPIHL